MFFPCNQSAFIRLKAARVSSVLATSALVGDRISRSRLWFEGMFSLFILWLSSMLLMDDWADILVSTVGST